MQDSELINDNNQNSSDNKDTQMSKIKALLAEGKVKGQLTYDQINKALPQSEMNSEQIEDVMSTISDMGIDVVDNEHHDEGKGDTPVEVESTSPNINNEKAVGESSNLQLDGGRTDDPVRLYLREMGKVELLSREGEIVIAKKIENGRNMMMESICENPETIKSILTWRDKLLNDEIFLREVIDLEDSYARRSRKC